MAYVPSATFVPSVTFVILPWKFMILLIAEALACCGCPYKAKKEKTAMKAIAQKSTDLRLQPRFRLIKSPGAFAPDFLFIYVVVFLFLLFISKQLLCLI